MEEKSIRNAIPFMGLFMGIGLMCGVILGKKSGNIKMGMVYGLLIGVALCSVLSLFLYCVTNKNKSNKV